MVQITPIEDAAVSGTHGIIDLHDPAHPELAALVDFDPNEVEFTGAVKLDLGGRKALRNIDISVPAPVGAAAEDQYFATELVTLRGGAELMLSDLASFAAAACALDATRCVVSTGFERAFPLITVDGIYAIHRALECMAFPALRGFTTSSD